MSKTIEEQAKKFLTELCTENEFVMKEIDITLTEQKRLILKEIDNYISELSKTREKNSSHNNRLCSMKIVTLGSLKQRLEGGK